MRHLAQEYVRLLPCRAPGANVRLIAYSLGCRIAHHMAAMLEQADGARVDLVLLDGPIGPDSANPPRMGGFATEVASRIQAEVHGGAPAGSGVMPHDVSLDATGLDALVKMVIGFGHDMADVAAALLKLPNDTMTADAAEVRARTLLISAASSDNLVNGTVEAAVLCLPQLEHVTVPGDHFGFMRDQAVDVATRVRAFFAAREGVVETSGFK